MVRRLRRCGPHCLLLKLATTTTSPWAKNAPVPGRREVGAQTSELLADATPEVTSLASSLGREKLVAQNVARSNQTTGQTSTTTSVSEKARKSRNTCRPA